MTTFTQATIPPVTGLGPEIVRIDPNLYMNHTAENIVPELSDHLTTIGISDGEVWNKFLRILLTGDLHTSAQGLLDTVLGLVTTVSYDPMLHETNDSIIRFKLIKPYMSEPAVLGKCAPCPKSTIVEKGCKRQVHGAGINIELALLNRIYSILSRDEAELRTKFPGMQEVVEKYNKLRLQSLDSLSQSFKRGTIKNVMGFIKEIAPDLHIVRAIRQLMSQTTVKEMTSAQIVRMMNTINDDFTKTTFTCNAALPKFIDALNNCIKLTNGHKLLEDIDYSAKGTVTEDFLQMLGKDMDCNLNEFQTAGVLIVGDRTKELIAQITKRKEILTDTRRGIITFAQSDYTSAITSGIVVCDSRMQSTIDKLASLRLMHHSSSSASNHLSVVRGQLDPNCSTADCFGGNNGMTRLSCESIRTAEGEVAVFSASEMFKQLNKSCHDICMDTLNVVAATILGTTSAMCKSSNRSKEDVLPNTIYWKNAQGQTVNVSQKKLLPFLCIPQLYNDKMLKHFISTNNTAIELYSMEKLVKQQCPHGTTTYDNVFVRGSLMQRDVLSQNYIGNRAKNSYHLNHESFSRANDIVQLELTPMMDVVVSRLNGRGCVWKHSQLADDVTLPADELKLEVFPRMIHGNIPSYLQENLCRVKQGENFARAAHISEDEIASSLSTLQRSLNPEAGYCYKFYACQYILMSKYSDSKQIIRDAETLVFSETESNQLLLSTFRAVDIEFEKRRTISMCTNRMLLEAISHLSKNQELRIHSANILTYVEKIYNSLKDMLHHGAQILKPNTYIDETLLIEVGKNISWLTDVNAPCPVPMRGMFSNISGKNCTADIEAFVASREPTHNQKQKYTGNSNVYRSWKKVSSLCEVFQSTYDDVIKDKIFYLMLCHIAGAKLCIGHINPKGISRKFMYMTSDAFGIKCDFKKIEADCHISDIIDAAERQEHYKNIVKTRNHELFKFFGEKQQDDGSYISVTEPCAEIQNKKNAIAHESDVTEYFIAMSRKHASHELNGVDIDHENCIFRSRRKPGPFFTTNNTYNISDSFSGVGILFLNARDNCYLRQGINQTEPLAFFPYITPLASCPLVPTQQFGQWNGLSRSRSALDVCPDPITYQEYFSTHRLQYVASVEKLASFSAYQRALSALPMSMYLNPLSFCVGIEYLQHFGFAFVLCRNDVVNTESVFFARTKSIQVRQADPSVLQNVNPKDIITEVYETTEMNEVLSDNVSIAIPHVTFTGFETDLNFHLRNYAKTNSYGIDSDTRVSFKEIYEYLYKNNEDAHIASGINPSITDVVIAPTCMNHSYFSAPVNPRGSNSLNAYLHSEIPPKNADILMFQNQPELLNPWAQNLLSVSDIVHRLTAQAAKNPSHENMIQMFSVPLSLNLANRSKHPASLFKKLKEEVNKNSKKRKHCDSGKYINNFSLCDSHHKHGTVATINAAIPLMSYSHPSVVHESFRSALAYKIRPSPYEHRGNYLITSETSPYGRTGLYDDIYTPYVSPVQID